MAGNENGTGTRRVAKVRGPMVAGNQGSHWVTNVVRRCQQEIPSSRTVGASPGRKPLTTQTGSKRLTHWTSETVLVCENTGAPQNFRHFNGFGLRRSKATCKTNTNNAKSLIREQDQFVLRKQKIYSDRDKKIFPPTRWFGHSTHLSCTFGLSKIPKSMA